MSEFCFAWSPRLLQAGRTTRLPLRSDDADVDIDTGAAHEVDRRWSQPDRTLYLYVRAPTTDADVTIRASRHGQEASCRIGVRSLGALRQPGRYSGAEYPRRWPLTGASTPSSKTSQVLTDLTLGGPDAELINFWQTVEDDQLWRQLPVAELPRAHFVNCHQGCPGCGTAIFAFSGFYPWVRSHTPADFNSTCPQCGLRFPDNDLLAGDFSGQATSQGTSQGVIDDGYGYVDASGHLFLFAATYCRDQTRAFGASIGAMAAHVRAAPNDVEAARRLSLMLLRYAAEEVYLAAVPQFRYGPTLGTELLWEWTTTGQTDWAAQQNPVAALYRMGTQRYCIDTPYISETLAIAYDTVWPLLREDQQIVDRARACGLDLEGPADAVALVEEMLRSLLQVHLDGGASSNLPRVSEGVLVLLRVLQRGDGQDALAWIYDEGPDELRVFTSNDFFPDGTPPESTGGYNNIHTNGLFALEHHLRQLKADQPSAYDDVPSLLDDPRANRIVQAPYDITMAGGAFLGFGDGGGPAVQQPLAGDAFHAPLAPRSLNWAAEYLGDAATAELRDAVTARRHLRRNLTILDGVGLAVLRRHDTGGLETAAAGIVYGDTSGHRHQDLLDVQLWARGQPFLSDLGYPQSWASREPWEGHWATHNSLWATIPDVASQLAGRGRVVRSLCVEGAQIIEIEATRWIEAEGGGCSETDVTMRRLIALLATEDDGTVLLDLSRVAGGQEHFRLCRGLEGELTVHGARSTSVAGTLAGASRPRGDDAGLDHPDHAGLAWMDDVASLDAADGWLGTWQSRHDPAAHLDMHVLRAGDANAFTARATEVMGTPESSTYQYRALCWRRNAGAGAAASAFDLVFEPRHDDARVQTARRIDADDADSIGVDLTTTGGRRLRLWWAPGDPSGAEFADGTRLDGGLALDLDGQKWALAPASTGRITGLDRQAGWIDVAGLPHLATGDRLTVNPHGRGRNYAVIRQQASDGGQRLWLDVTSQLGRGKVMTNSVDQLHLRYALFTRTGYLHGARLCPAADDATACATGVEIVAAWNPDSHHTQVRLAQPLSAAEAGDWVWAVDYIIGDEVGRQAICTDHRKGTP